MSLVSAHTSQRVSAGLYIVFFRTRGRVYLYCATCMLTYVYALIFSVWVLILDHLHHTSLQGAAQAALILQSFPSVAEKTFERPVDTVTFEAGPPPAMINTLSLV